MLTGERRAGASEERAILKRMEGLGRAKPKKVDGFGRVKPFLKYWYVQIKVPH